MSAIEITRFFDLAKALQKKSLFLLGPRQTGKSWLVRHALPDARVYDLLDSDTFLSLSRRPKVIEEELSAHPSIVVIDEVQKLPSLLDEVHRLIENRRVRFLLTGSSARKLRRGGVNLLGGRARSQTLHPFIRRELGEHFDLMRALNRGLLPSIYFSDDPDADLRAYAGDYLQQEIAAEGLTRNIPAFSRFLQVAALCNSQLINYSSVASDAQVALSTVREYFQILKDTLIAFEVPAWKQSLKRKPIGTSKFYWFDVGVARHLQNRSTLRSRSPEMGDAFETYIAHELRTLLDYCGGDLRYWRSTSGFEVDFIVNDELAIEVKAKETVSDRDLRGLQALQEEGKLKRYVVACFEPRPRRVGAIHILPWYDALDALAASLMA